MSEHALLHHFNQRVPDCLGRGPEDSGAMEDAFGNRKSSFSIVLYWHGSGSFDHSCLLPNQRAVEEEKEKTKEENTHLSQRRKQELVGRQIECRLGRKWLARGRRVRRA